MSQDILICTSCQKPTKITAIEVLRLRRRLLDASSYVCPNCEQVNKKQDMLHYGLPIVSAVARRATYIPNDQNSEHSSASKITKMRLKDSPAIRAALARYQLFAFVLFDPEKHLEMRNRMQKRYEQLDEDTGESLLFFSYFQPNQEWLAQRHSEMPDLADMWEVFEDTNPTLTLDLLALQLHIEPTELPCLVITTSLFDAIAPIVIPTNATDIVRQLPSIATIANSLATDEYSRTQPSELTLQLIESRLTESFGDVVRRRKIANVQDSVVAVIQRIASASTDDIVVGIQSSLATLQQARLELQGLYVSTESEEFQLACLQIDDLCDALMNWLYIGTRHLTVTQKNDLPSLVIPSSALESTSAQYLDTYQRLASVYAHILQDDQDNCQIDYSPFAIALTKMFELEINLSIVQLIRYLHDIEMPTYYNKVQKGKYVVVDDHNFNTYKSTSTELRSPGIGQTYYVVERRKDEFREKIYEIVSRGGSDITTQTWSRKYQKILEKWCQIIPKRNTVAHPDPINLHDVEEIVKLLNEFGDGFTYLAIVKKVLRNHDDNA